MAHLKSGTKKIAPVILIAVLAFVVSLMFTLINPVQTLELRYTDQLFEWRGPLDVSDSPIVLVAISQKADGEIPQKYPWPTEVYARLIENLNRAGAKTIAFDVLFDNVDDHDAKNDTLFANAIEKYGNVILAGDLERSQDSLSDLTTPIFPLNVLSQNNPNRVAMVAVNPDLDGAIRSYKFGYEHQNKNYYWLGLEALRNYRGITYDKVDDVRSNRNSPYFHLGPYNILKDSPNSFLINYYGPEGTFPEVSLEEVIDDESYTTVFESELEFSVNSFNNPEVGHLALETFKDKIVIVGATMVTLKDFFPTPFANAGRPDRPGYQVHAHAMQTILDANYLHRMRGWYTLIIMLLFCFLVTILNHFYRANIGTVLSMFLGLMYIGVTYWFFINQNMIMVFTGPMLSILFTQAGMFSYEYYVEQKEKRRIKGMFSSYVSPELVNQMIESGEEPQLGGEETYMTAFFSDIVSFSTFSEQLQAKQLVQIINEYLSSMTTIINKQGGTLDKYIGDAIVAFFGSPIYFEDHAFKACLSSQLMQRELRHLREKWKKDGWPDIVANMDHRIGLNTGLMVTGNMGSSQRFNYTMMGDNVNIASRCETGARKYGVYTMVTETTKEEAEQFGDDCVFRLLDNVIVKGRSKPLEVYEICGLREEADQKLYDCIGLYEEAIKHYLNQEWDTALAKFERSLELERYANNPSGIFITRCRMMKQDAPGEDWNGVFLMESK